MDKCNVLLVLIEVNQKKYAWLYVFHFDIALRQSMNMRENLQCKGEIMNDLDNVIRHINPYSISNSSWNGVIAKQGLKSVERMCSVC